MDRKVSALGLGCMGMSTAYGPANEEESLQILHRYLRLGGNFLDTAEVYGFYDEVPSGSRFLVFGATRTVSNNPTAPPSEIAPDPPDNYHRWWNNPWRVVEPAGQSNAGAWTKEKESRLRELVQLAHKRGIWIRFYTLDGVSKADERCRGIFHLYNFGKQ